MCQVSVDPLGNRGLSDGEPGRVSGSGSSSHVPPRARVRRECAGARASRRGVGYSATMLGLVPAEFIPSARFPMLSEPIAHRSPVLAWNAASHPPPARPVTLGLVPEFIPSPVSPLLSAPIVHRLVVLAWNAASHPPPVRLAMLGLVPEIIPSPVSPR